MDAHKLDPCMQGVVLGGSVGKSGSYLIDVSKYTTGGTYVVSV